jgi:ParB family chromosome partitioning protein
MAKDSVEAYRATGKCAALFFDPDDLVIVTDPNHALFDRRALVPFEEPMVLNIMVEGVHQSITVTKDVETGQTIVVDGRRRVINAREANRRLREAGKDVRRVPAIPRRDGIAALTSVMVSTNEIRRADSPMNRAEKMAVMRSQGRTNEEIALSFGMEPSSIDGQFRLLECCADVRDALERDEITVTHALRLSKLEPALQRLKVAELRAAAEGKTGHAKSRAQRAALAGDGFKSKTKAEIKRELAICTGERAAALRWVLGLDEDDTAPEVDPRQLTIIEAQ